MLFSPHISTLLPYTTLFRSNSYAPSAYRQMARHRGDATIWYRWHRTDQLYFARCTWTFWTQRANTHPSTHGIGDRKSTRLNSSHVAISYAVFCLKKKTI